MDEITRYYMAQIRIIMAAFVLNSVTVAALVIAFPVLRLGVAGGIIMGTVGFCAYYLVLSWWYDRREQRGKEQP